MTRLANILPALAVLTAISAAASPAGAQALGSWGAPLAQAQGETFVLSPADGSAAGIVRGAKMTAAGAAVATVFGGFEQGRPEFDSGASVTKPLGGRIMLSADIGADWTGCGIRSALGLPGNEQSACAGFSAALQALPGVNVTGRAERYQGGVLGRPADAVSLGMQAALSGRLVVSATGLHSTGDGGELLALGFTWQPEAGGLAISGSGALGSAALSPLTADQSPDTAPSRMQLAIIAPISDGMSIRIGFRSGFGPVQPGSLNAQPLTAIITRNL